MVEWLRRIEESCALVDDTRAFLNVFEDYYHRLRDKRLAYAHARRVARAEDARFLANALRSAVYCTGYSVSSFVRRVDDAVDWLNDEVRSAQLEQSNLSTYIAHRYANAVLAESEEQTEDEGAQEGAAVEA